VAEVSKAVDCAENRPYVIETVVEAIGPSVGVCQLREASLARLRGYQPRQAAAGTGRHPKLALPAWLAATLLCDRHGLPQKTLAGLLQVAPETLNRRIGDIRQLLHQIGHTLTPSPHRLTTLHELRRYATDCGITSPTEIKTAS